MHSLIGIGVMVALSFFLPTVGRSEHLPHSGCLSLPEQGPVNTVSISATKALDVPGFICTRVINGRSEDLALLESTPNLQKWERRWLIKGGFRDFSAFREHPSGMIIGGTLSAKYISAGATMDYRLPLYGPVPPGRYRACLRYRLTVAEPKRKDYEVCSEEVTLP